MAKLLTQRLVKSELKYITKGCLVWTINKNKVKKGDKFGCIGEHGYVRGIFCGNNVREHRLIFLYHYGYLPEEIDHIDRDKGNNRIENLRAATKQQNMQNKSIRIDNSSGFKCVSLHSCGKYRVQLRVNDKPTHFGLYSNAEDAAVAYNIATLKYQGKFAYQNTFN